MPGLVPSSEVEHGLNIRVTDRFGVLCLGGFSGSVEKERVLSEVGSKGCVHERTPDFLLDDAFGARLWSLCAFKKTAGLLQKSEVPKGVGGRKWSFVWQPHCPEQDVPDILHESHSVT